MVPFAGAVHLFDGGQVGGAHGRQQVVVVVVQLALGGQSEDRTHFQLQL